MREEEEEQREGKKGYVDFGPGEIERERQGGKIGVLIK